MCNETSFFRLSSHIENQVNKYYVRRYLTPSPAFARKRKKFAASPSKALPILRNYKDDPIPMKYFRGKDDKVEVSKYQMLLKYVITTGWQSEEMNEVVWSNGKGLIVCKMLF